MKRCCIDSTNWILSPKIASSLILISLIASYGLLLFGFRCLSNPELWALSISAFMAIANAILLFSTLQSQKEAFSYERETRKLERFETTFFNLLEFQRKLTEDICICSGYINENAKPISQEIHGRHFFHFAIHELEMIRSSLTSNMPIKKYREEDVDLSIGALEEKWRRQDSYNSITEDSSNEWEKFLKQIRLEYCNLVYDISEETKRFYLSGKVLPYDLFKKKWYIHYEHYFRNLNSLLALCTENTKDIDAQQKYVSFIKSQMSNNELHLIQVHAQSDLEFKKTIDNNWFNKKMGL